MGSGATGYDCREILGHPDLGYYGHNDWFVYKDSVLKQQWDADYGNSLVLKNGIRMEGCVRWVPDKVHGGEAQCDYKVGSSGHLPAMDANNGNAVLYQTLQTWGSNTNAEAQCALAIVDEWVGLANPGDVTMACAAVAT